MSDDQTPQDDAAEQRIVQDVFDFTDIAVTALQNLADRHSLSQGVTMMALESLNAKMLNDTGMLADEHAEEFMEAFDRLVKLYAERKQKGGS